MVRGRLAWLVGLGATLALLAAACTKSNPSYCADAEHFQCSVLDAGVDEPAPDAVEAVEAMADQSPGDVTEVAETAADGIEAGDGGDADVVPGCTSNPPSCAGNPEGKTICDSTTHVCRGCRIDDECTGTDDAGICLAARCVPKGDVILVDNAFPGCVTMSPTPGARMCEMAGALNQVRLKDERRRIIVVANDQGPWTHALSPQDNPVVTVVGRKSARFFASTASPGITLTGSVEVVLRGIQVEGMPQIKPGILVNAGAIATLEQVRVSNGAIGVQVEGAARITIERSLLLKNGVGLSVKGTEFTVRNTVIAENGSVGVLLEDPGVGKPMRFQNNTLFSNSVQLTCPVRLMATALLIYPGAGSVSCMLLNSPPIDDPMFDSSSNAEPYHLTAASPCRNAGDSVDFPDVDIDGDLRPMGGRSDCGADEFKE